MTFETVKKIGRITSITVPVTNARVLATQQNTTLLTTKNIIREIAILANVLITHESEQTDTTAPLFIIFLQCTTYMVVIVLHHA
jgi:hypothetical protein